MATVVCRYIGKPVITEDLLYPIEIQNTVEDPLAAATVAVKSELQERVFTERGLLQQSRPPHSLMEGEDQGKEAGGRHSKNGLSVKDEVDVKEELLEGEMFESVDSKENVIFDEVKEEEEEDFDSAEYDEEGDVEMSGREMRPHFPPPTSANPLLPTMTVGADAQVLLQDQTTTDTDQLPSEEDESSPTPPRLPSRKRSAKPSRGAPKTTKKKRKGPCVLLTDDQEQDLADWLEFEAPFIYNKSLKEHADRNKVNKAFEEKAASLDPPITGTQLATWFDSVRTRFGKISNPPENSGQGASKRLTVREEWIRAIFSFLRPHIIRQRRTKTFDLEPVVNVSPGEASQEGGGRSATPLVPTSTPTPDSVPTLQQARATSAKTKSEHRAALLEEIVEQGTSFKDMVPSTLAPTPAAQESPALSYWKDVFNPIAHDCVEIGERFRSDLLVEIATLIRRWKRLAATGVKAAPPEFMINMIASVDEARKPPPRPPSPPPVLNLLYQDRDRGWQGDLMRSSRPTASL